MATMTIEEFKRRWETDNPPIMNDDCADCATARIVRLRGV